MQKLRLIRLTIAVVRNHVQDYRKIGLKIEGGAVLDLCLEN